MTLLSQLTNSSFQGYTGSQGPIGYTGSRGDVGYTGSKGDLGYTGSIGFTGSQGITGYTGSKGDIGYTGSLGYTGSKGDIGYTGSASTVIGYTGSQGVIGFTGSKGDIGFTGSQGITGFTGSVGFTGSQGITGFTGSVNNSIPQNSQTSSYTLALSDSGKHISITTGGVTVPNSIFSAGDTVVIFNNNTSTQIITQGINTTLRWAGTSNTGNRNLISYGVATIMCFSANNFVIGGTGLT